MLRLPPATALVPAVLAVLVAGGGYWLVGDININLSDEGFLWYGVVHTLRGEVPMRDFQAYDPGRYIWCAAWSLLFGHGILGVRASVAVFEGLGLFLGLLACRRFARGLPALSLCALILGLWMFPRHKLFEPAIALAAVYFAVRLVEDPRPRNHLLAGAFTGLAAWFGRNHGVYLTLGFSSLVLYLTWKHERARLTRNGPAFAAGVVLGSSPLWGMWLFVPGFALAFVESTRLILRHGANLPEPYFWPWLADLSEVVGFDVAGVIGLIAAYQLPVLLYPLGLLACLTTKRADLERRAVVVASALVGVFYTHHAAVRSDSAHLAQSLPPLLLLALALPGGLGLPGIARALTWTGLTVISFLAATVSNPTLENLSPRTHRIGLVPHEIAGEKLRLLPMVERTLSGVEAAVRSRVGEGEALFIAPGRPTLYPLLGKKSPVWWLYFFWPASVEEQRETIARLEEQPVNWALIIDTGVNDREDLRFQGTNPLVWRYLFSDFRLVNDERLAQGYLLFQRRR